VLLKLLGYEVEVEKPRGFATSEYIKPNKNKKKKAKKHK
jgi:hypothetical protein